MPMPVIGAPRPATCEHICVLEMGCGLDDGAARRSGSFLKIPEPTNTASAPVALQGCVSRVAFRPHRTEEQVAAGSPKFLRREWRLKLLRPIEELGRVSLTNTTNITQIERR